MKIEVDEVQVEIYQIELEDDEKYLKDRPKHVVDIDAFEASYNFNS